MIKPPLLLHTDYIAAEVFCYRVSIAAQYGLTAVGMRRNSIDTYNCVVHTLCKTWVIRACILFACARDLSA